MDGYLLVDKPTGISSFGVVAKVRRALSEAAGHKVKTGHTGTLDPMATGLMILVVGKYTKRASEFSKLDKTYEAELTLGQVSTTADSEGRLTFISDKKPSMEEIEQVLRSFAGEIMQKPPVFSAIKVNGQRAYKLARANKEVVIEPRKVIVHSIEQVNYDYPYLGFATTVSSGTYIRSLAVDIGEKLGTAAYLSALRRTKIADYNVADAITLNDLSAEIIQAELKQLPN